MHGGSSEKFLSPAGRQYAKEVFGPVMERARAAGSVALQDV
jgi:hypothetical protein